MFFMKKSFATLLMISFSFFIIYSCTDSKTESPEPTTTKANFGGFESQVKWGEHLVTIGACHDCHTPKKMTAQGPVEDMDLALSGHQAAAPDPDVNRKEMQDKGLVVTGDLTSWVGPWGISYTANLTSDSTGTGMWKEEQFIMALREGKFKGLASGRTLLPPMPWAMYKHMTDDELKAIFAYLKTTKPIKNVVPPPVPPATK
jgi:hypothetical protein